MTGFGQAQSSSPAVDLSVNIRSVNGRYLDIKFQLPSEYASLENDFKKILQKNSSRGTISVSVSRKLNPEKANPKALVNSSKAKEWMKAYKGLAKKLGLAAEVNMEQIARIPDLIRVHDDDTVTKQELATAIKTFENAVQACEKEKIREGKSLQADILKSIQLLMKQIEIMKSHSKNLKEITQATFSKKLEKLKLDKTLDEQRMAQEVALLIDRSDISEEIVRLDEHLRFFHEILNDSQASGKKLDFYTQELLREVNTIGSKSHNVELTKSVVEAKTLIEKMREQVQNAE